MINPPTITFVLADNQRVIAKALNKSGATIDAGCVHALEPADFAKNTLQPLIDSTEARRALSHNARSICAGQGAAFVALAVLLPERVSDEVMALRNATMDDAQLIYDWQCHPRHLVEQCLRCLTVPVNKEFRGMVRRRQQKPPGHALEARPGSVLQFLRQASASRLLSKESRTLG